MRKSSSGTQNGRNLVGAISILKGMRSIFEGVVFKTWCCTQNFSIRVPHYLSLSAFPSHHDVTIGF